MNVPLMIPVGVALLVGVSGGFLLGRMTQNGDVSSEIVENEGAASDSPQRGQKVALGGGRSKTGGRTATPQPITAEELRKQFATVNSANRGPAFIRFSAELQERLRNSDVLAIVREMASEAYERSQYPAFDFALAVLAETQPKEAWKVVGECSNPRIMARLRRVVIGAVAEADPAQAVAIVEGIPEAPARNEMRGLALSSLSVKDPAMALELYLEGDRSPQNNYQLSTIFSRWAELDLEGAKAALGRLSGDAARIAESGFLSSYAQRDPQAAWRYVMLQGQSGSREDTTRVLAVSQAWATQDPQAALVAAEALQNATLRNTALRGAVQAWAQSDFQGALEYASKVSDSTMRAQLFASLPVNGTNAPKLLTALYEHMPPGDQFQNSVQNVFRMWAAEDPRAAATAVLQYASGRALTDSAAMIAMSWAKNTQNPQEVIEWARTLPEGDGRKRVLGSFFSQWSSENPLAAAQSLGALQAEERGQAVNAIARTWSRQDPAAALAWAGSLSDPAERSTATRSVFSGWADAEPVVAARYYEALPPDSREGLLGSVVDRWASKDTAAAAEWLKRQPAGGERDEAVATLARKMAMEDPMTGLAWANSISDPSRRIKSLQGLAQDWLRQDKAAATDWILRSDVPEVRKLVK